MMNNPVTRLTPVVRMTRVPPDDLDWTPPEAYAYEAELVLELYIQGRSFDHVADVTGWPASIVRELARTAGVERSPRRHYEITAWREASRALLDKVERTDLLYAWLDGCEAEQLAAKYGTPADMMWEVIAAELATTSRRVLGSRPARRLPTAPLSCSVGTCWYACTFTCAGPAGEYYQPHSHQWPPAGRLHKAVTVNSRGRADWRDTTKPPD